MVVQDNREEVTHPLYVARQAAKVGAASGATGLLVGLFTGTVSSAHPFLFAAGTSIQWVALGSTFWGSRTFILNSGGLYNWYASTRGLPMEPRTDLFPTPQEKVRASTISGVITGATVGGLLRGPRNLLPGALMFGLFGWGGQSAFEYFDRQQLHETTKSPEMKAEEAQKAQQKETLLQRIAKSKLIPGSVLSDQEYQDLLTEKLIRVEADIAMIDERIEEFRKLQKEQAEKAVQEATETTAQQVRK